MHADAPSALTGLWVRIDSGKQIWRFARAPGHTARRASAWLAWRAIRDVSAFKVRCRMSILPPVGVRVPPVRERTRVAP